MSSKNLYQISSFPLPPLFPLSQAITIWHLDHSSGHLTCLPTFPCLSPISIHFLCSSYSFKKVSYVVFALCLQVLCSACFGSTYAISLSQLSIDLVLNFSPLHCGSLQTLVASPAWPCLGLSWLSHLLSSALFQFTCQVLCTCCSLGSPSGVHSVVPMICAM
jgi:hypothetical protein